MEKTLALCYKVCSRGHTEQAMNHSRYLRSTGSIHQKRKNEQKVQKARTLLHTFVVLYDAVGYVTSINDRTGEIMVQFKGKTPVQCNPEPCRPASPEQIKEFQSAG